MCSDAEMPRPRPPHVHRETNRHGTTVWYVRVDHGPRIRLPCAPGGPGFDAAYRAAIAGEASDAARRGRAGTIKWLIGRYTETSAWADLSPATRKQRMAILRQIISAVGDAAITDLNRASVVAARDKRRDTPAQARHFLDTIRALFAWALEAGLVTTNPAEGVKPPKGSKSAEGFPAWTMDDVATFEAKWPAGSRQRLAMHILLYTGLRRGDAALLGRQHIRDGVITLRTTKTGAVVTLRVAPQLAASIAASPTGDLTFICGERGRPLVKEVFGNLFGAWCREAGIKKSAHGLRKLAATLMAERGATVAELESVFGWSGGRMASLYTRSADRARIGLRASAMLAGTPSEHPIPAPEGKCGNERE